MNGSSRNPRPRLGRRIGWGLAILAILGAVGVAALFASLWAEHTTQVTLPTPTGLFGVGRTTYAWADDVRLDTLAPTSGTRRELVVWIWYPSAAAPSTPSTEDYLPPRWREEITHARGTLISEFLTRDLSQVHTHSVRDANVSPQQRSYPVVIMRAGASAEVTNYSTLAEDLASHGYVVVGFDAPYRTNVVVFPDGRVMRRIKENNPERCLEMKGAEQTGCVDRLMTAWTSDIAFVLDRLAQLNAADASASASRKFAGRLDMTRVGVFGHSFGGATAAQFCHDDARCKAGIDVDGAPHGSVIQAGLRQPFMFLLSDHGTETDRESRQILADIQSIYDRLPPDRRLRLAIRGANHFLFSDDGALLKSSLILQGFRAFGRLGIEGRRQLAVTAYCVHSFFDAYLKHDSTSRLQISSPLYPEIQILE